MAEYKLSIKQHEALTYIGSGYEILKQYLDGTILIAAGKARFTISPGGTVEEIKGMIPEEKGKKKQKTPKKLGQHRLTDNQKHLMESHGNPPMVRMLDNGDIVVKYKGEEWVFGYDGLIMTKKEYDKKYASAYGLGKPSKKAKPYVYVTTTVCQEKPETCKPRQIEHVAWDADHTIWNLSHGIASGVNGPLEKIDDNTVIELGKPYTPFKWEKKEKGEKEEPKGYYYGDFWSQLAQENEEWWKEKPQEEEIKEIEESIIEGLTAEEIDMLKSMEVPPEVEMLPPALPPGKPEKETKGEEKLVEINRITLLPTFRETLDRLEKMGVKSSVISLNTEGTVKRILDAFGLKDRFVEIRDSWDNKGKVFSDITHKYNLCPCSSIFVDDTNSNVRDVAKECGMGLVIGTGKDVEKPIDIFKFIKES